MSEQRDAKAKRCQSKDLSKQRDVKAKRCQSKGMSKKKGCNSKKMSKQRDVKGKGCKRKGMRQQKDVKARGCQSKEMSEQRDVRCQSKRMSEQRDVKAKGCQSKGMSKQRDVKAKGCQSKGMSKQRDVKAKQCQSKGMSKQRDGKWKSRTEASFSHLPLSLFEGRLARKLRFHIFNFHFLKGGLAWKLRFHIFPFHFLKDVSHESLVFKSSTFTFWGTSRTKALFSHLQLLFFEAHLARKLRFTSSSFIFWGTSRTKASFSHLALSLFGDISHGIRLNWDARNVVFCRTKRGANGWGSFSGGRLRNRFVCTGIMVGSAALWNWQFRRCFADVLAGSSIVFCNSVFADRIVMAASRLLGAAVEWLHQGCHSDLSADFLNFGAGDFPLKNQWKSASKSSFYCFGIEIRFWSCNFWRRCA